ncbi:DUF1036 domain-containing protein [Geminocystis sp. CENA526]|uniref:DUF1036 domain-containing protein n=1 Tax=Geminocystis sp. CENA526 TaxID=1355871 RepID=UPI003D6F57D3
MKKNNFITSIISTPTFLTGLIPLLSSSSIFFIISILFPIFFTPQKVLSQEGNCSQRVIGERCHIIFRADSGHAGSTRDPKDTGELERAVPSGYVVVNFQEVNESTRGGQFLVSNVSRGQRSNLKREFDSVSSRLSEFEGKINALYQDPQTVVPVRAKLEMYQRELQQLREASRYVSSTESNTDIFKLRARAEYTCTVRAIGQCLDGYGNRGKGYVRVNLVYVGDSPVRTVNEIERQLNLISPIQRIYNYQVTNSCRHPIRVAIRYRNIQQQWVTQGWWNLTPGKSISLGNNNGTLLASDNGVWYYYAESTNNTGLSWSGQDNKVSYDGRTLNMRKETNNGDHGKLNLTCP